MMMKRWMILSLVMLLLLPAAMAEQTGVADQLAVTLGQDAEDAPALFALGSPVLPLLDAMEAAFDERYVMTEADSCMFSGKDREYAVEGMIVGTYPIAQGGADQVESIFLTREDVTLPCGARVGMTADELTALLGSPQEEADDLLVWTENAASITATLTEGRADSLFLLLGTEP